MWVGLWGRPLPPKPPKPPKGAGFFLCSVPLLLLALWWLLLLLSAELLRQGSLMGAPG